MASPVYYNGSYSSDHWAMHPYNLEDQKVIALGYYKGLQYSAYLNPTDKRGYRCIVRLIKNSDMASTFNRIYTADEQQGLSFVISLVERVYGKFLTIVQTFKAGNNAHRFDQNKRITYVGTAEEPSFLHAHVVGRGDPEEKSLAGVKLDGPIPGLMFDMRAQTPCESGNERKVIWEEGDMAKVSNVLRKEIEKTKKEYEKFGLTIVTTGN